MKVSTARLDALINTVGELVIAAARSPRRLVRLPLDAWRLRKELLTRHGVVAPPAPGCLPGRRPEDVREEDRCGLRYGGSDEGGFEEFDESEPSRRSNPAIRAVNASICPVSVSICTACVLITSRRPLFAFRSAMFVSCSAAISSASDDAPSPDTLP